MIFFVSPKYYVYLSLALVLLSPALLLFPLLLFQQTQVLYNVFLGISLIAHISGMTFTWRYNSSPRLSFLKGLEVITNANMSGCANVTMLYILPLLTITYYIAFFNALKGLRKGKRFTEQKWIQVVDEYETIRRYR